MARVKRKNRRKHYGPVTVNYSAAGPSSWSMRIGPWSWNSRQRRHRLSLGTWWKLESGRRRNLVGVPDEPEGGTIAP